MESICRIFREHSRESWKPALEAVTPKVKPLLADYWRVYGEEKTDEDLDGYVEYAFGHYRLVEKLGVEKGTEVFTDIVQKVKVESRRKQFRPIRGGKPDSEPSLKSKFTL